MSRRPLILVLLIIVLTIGFRAFLGTVMHHEKEGPTSIGFLITAIFICLGVLLMLPAITWLIVWGVRKIKSQRGLSGASAGTAQPTSKHSFHTLRKWAIVILALCAIHYGLSWLRATWRPTTPPIGSKCLDANGSPVEIHNETLGGDHFTLHHPGGCEVFVALPNGWSDYWGQQNIGHDHDQQVSLYTADGNWQGTYGWNEHGRTHLPKMILVYAKKPGDLQFSDTNNFAYTAKNRDVIRPTAITPVPRAECTAAANDVVFAGTATVSLFVGKDGIPYDVKIMDSTGITSLDAKMVEATQKYTFNPATRNGIPVRFQMENVVISLEKPCRKQLFPLLP
jgi:TonB family protein